MDDAHQLYQTTLQAIDKVKQLRLDNLKLRDQQGLLKWEQAKLEGTLRLEVYNLTDNQGRKQYTNEPVRKAEVQQRLEASSAYQERARKTATLEHVLQQNLIELEYLRAVIGLNQEYLRSVSTPR